MKKKRTYQLIMLAALCISFSCALYLNGQLQSDALEIVPTASSLTSIPSDHNIYFPEVEVLKVFVEKFIDVITLTTA